MAINPTRPGGKALPIDPYSRGFLDGLEDGHAEAIEAVSALHWAIECASTSEGIGTLEAGHLANLAALCGDGFKHRAQEARELFGGARGE